MAGGCIMRRASNPKYVTFGPTETFVTFATDRGQLRTNDAGESFFRDMADGRFTCASPDLERQLIDAGVRAGIPVGITRATFNRTVSWKIRIVAAVSEMPRAVPATNIGQARANGFPERLYAKPEPPVPAFPECEPPANGTVAPEKKIEQTQADSPTLIMRCMVAAVDAAAKATAHGQKIGFPVAFGPGEIERIAVTLYINSAQPPRYSKPNGQARSHYNATAAGAQQ
jgi:hypothetical protein